MEYIKDFSNFEIMNELLNLSKIRKWPYKQMGKWSGDDMYFIYDLPKKELGEYLNTWFVGSVSKSKDDKYTYVDKMITLKKVDKDTSRHLYNKIYNPVSININCPTGAKFKKNNKGEDLYTMKSQIHSIDDSSYSIWWWETPINELKEIRSEIMEWINTKSELNGPDFLDYCVTLGADAESKDYS